MPGIRELRTDLAAHVRRAAAGERVTITLSGQPAAVLAPLDASGGTDGAAGAANGPLIAPRRTDGRWATGRVRVWGTVRFDRLLREIRG